MLLFQERDFGEKINATFSYVGRHFRSLMLALLYIAGPVALLAGIVEGIQQSNLLDVQTYDDSVKSGGDYYGLIYKGPTLFLGVVAIKLLANLTASLVVYSHFKLYHQGTGSFRQVGAVWHEVLSALGRSVWISFLSFWLVLFGFMLLFVPAVYIGIVLSLSLPITVFEKTGFGPTLSRCFQLIQNKWWSTFGLVVVMSIIVFIVSVFFSIPSLVVRVLTMIHVMPQIPPIVPVLANVVNSIGVTVLSALIALALGFQYFNLVERQEGTGLLAAVDTIGTLPSRPTAHDDGEY